MGRKIFGRILLVLYIVAVAYLCFGKIDIPALSATWLGIPKDKIAHFAMYVPFPFLMFLAFHKPRRKPWSLIGFLILTLVIGMVIGGGIELIQGRLDYRSADIADFRADVIGTVVGVAFTFIWGAVSLKW